MKRTCSYKPLQAIEICRMIMWDKAILYGKIIIALMNRIWTAKKGIQSKYILAGCRLLWRKTSIKENYLACQSLLSGLPFWHVNIQPNAISLICSSSVSTGRPPSTICSLSISVPSGYCSKCKIQNRWWQNYIARTVCLEKKYKKLLIARNEIWSSLCINICSLGQSQLSCSLNLLYLCWTFFHSRNLCQECSTPMILTWFY